MKKENALRLIDVNLKKAKKARHHESYNSLDSDARAMIDETIASLEDLRQRVEAEPDEVGVDALVNQVRDIVDEKINAALEKVKDVTVEVANHRGSDYLASRNALQDFARCLRTTNGLDAMRTAWRDILKTNGVTTDGSEAFLPDMVKSRILDLWNSDTNWLRRLNNTGAKRFGLRFTQQDQDANEVRAFGHQNGEPKEEQTVSLEARQIEVQAIYKLQKLDNVVIFNDDGSLIEWIADELTRQVYYTIGRAILVGSGSGNTAVTSFQSLASDSAPFVKSSQFDGSQDIVYNVMESLIAPIYDGRDIILFCGKTDLFNLRRYVYSTGGTTRYASIDEVKDMLGVSDIVVVPYLNNSTPNAARMIAMHPDRYYTVGKMTDFEYLRFPNHLTNEEFFRAETFAGGAAALGCGSVLTNGSGQSTQPHSQRQVTPSELDLEMSDGV